MAVWVNRELSQSPDNTQWRDNHSEISSSKDKVEVKKSRLLNEHDQGQTPEDEESDRERDEMPTKSYSRTNIVYIQGC